MPDSPKATVLIVEDDPGVAKLLQLRLDRAGYQVQVATNAEEALELVRGQPIELMLLDQNLPRGVSGLELYQQVKEAGFDIPAILVTGFQGEGIVLQSFRAGVYDFVPKTTDYLDYLLPTIDRVLKKRHTEFQLMESEARLGSIVRSALDAVLTVDEGLRVGLFNPAAEQMFGVGSAAAVGQPIQKLLPAWTGDNGMSQKQEGKGEGPKPGGQIERWETEGVRADGGRFPVELSVSWVEANKRRFWTCFARDVSDRVKAQEERERLIREQAARKEAEEARTRLEALLAENSRLYKELQQTDRAKDEFLAMLSHELRNPLSPIRNALELIRLEDSARPEDRENWEVIDRQVSYLTRLVEDLLDVSRIQQGKVVLQKERTDAGAIVARAVESTRPLIDARRHTLAVSLPAEELPLDGDVVRLVQVLANLLNNAAKYTPEGGRITVTVGRVKDLVEVRVRDTGVGIPADLIHRLYDPFTQSKRTLDRSAGGLGIGLTLVRRLTEMHGGTVEAKSDGHGLGSEFVVRLPLAAGAGPKAAVAVRPPSRVKRRILLVDDHRDSARTLARLLTVLGHEVEVRHDGAAAVAAAREYLPEVVLLDIGLPGKDGYQVARELRADAAFARTVLIALTGYGSAEDRQLSREAGFNAHLVKPVDLKALTEALE